MSDYPEGLYAPWKYEPCGDSDGFVAGIDHFVIDSDGDEIACPPTEEHARLMAAAPDLLRACESVAFMSDCEDAADWKDAFHRLTSMCKNAARLARGE